MSDIESRDVAIVTHVDHGKTTLVNAMLEQPGAFSGHEEVADRVMNSGDLEKEKGITILAKNTAIRRKGEDKNGEDLTINIIDTPGCADFGGEVERALSMVNGAVLLIDSSEGSLPRIRFVLGKALAVCMPVIIVVDKTDRPDARIDEVVEEAQDLLLELVSTLEDSEAAEVAERNLELPVPHAFGRAGKASAESPGNGNLPEPENLQPLSDVTTEVLPEPSAEIDAPLQVQVTNLNSSSFLGRIGLTCIHKGRTRKGQQISWIYYDPEGNEHTKNAKAAELLRIVDVTRIPAQEAIVNDIVAISGIGEVMTGDSPCDVKHLDPLPRILVDEPAISMAIGANTSPLAGQGGGDKPIARMVKARLDQELIGSVSLRALPTERPDVWEVQGRGEMALFVLVEIMRREGSELTVGKPQAATKAVGDKVQEPYEHLAIDAPEEYLGAVTQLMTSRKGRMEYMGNQGTSWVRMEFLIPSRGLISSRTTFTTETKGIGAANHYLAGYGEWTGEIKDRPAGSLVVDRTGQITAHALTQLFDRGTFFIEPGDQAYEGMVVDQNPRDEDMDINIIREKKLTNIRAVSADVTVTLEKAHKPSFDEAMEFCGADECAEVAPEGIHVRKQILSTTDRACARPRVRAMNKKQFGSLGG